MAGISRRPLPRLHLDTGLPMGAGAPARDAHEPSTRTAPAHLWVTAPLLRDAGLLELVGTALRSSAKREKSSSSYASAHGIFFTRDSDYTGGLSDADSFLSWGKPFVTTYMTTKLVERNSCLPTAASVFPIPFSLQLYATAIMSRFQMEWVYLFLSLVRFVVLYGPWAGICLAGNNTMGAATAPVLGG